MISLALLTIFKAQSADIVLADFEGRDYGKWQVKGIAFGSKPANGTLPSQMAVSGFEGNGLANSFVGGDDTTGSLTSPSFKIQHRYLNFLIGGGYQPNLACINLIVEGRIVITSTGTSTTGQDTEALRQATWDLEKFRGKEAKIQILDIATGGWGHINIDSITLSNSAKANPQPPLTTQMKPTDVPNPEPIYREKYRPQFHFSAKQNWLNDPNGMIYFDGLYHLFFQHNPLENKWGNMTWGHAVSRDLVHWQQRANAIEPDKLGTIFSGSAAFDEDNTSGLGTKENPPLVAMYTAAGQPFTQCLAYSLDKGKTWQKYASNPILNHIVHENRDPRIFWHKPSKQWIMALYLDHDDFAIYGSPNLKEWKELSKYTLTGSNECPELFEIPIEGTKETKWIFFGANYRYVVGSFDGKEFKPEQDPIRGDYGANFYASQTYNHTPDGRRIQIAWMNGPGPYPNMPFNQQMSFPCELKLIRTEAGLRLTRTPVQELYKLHDFPIQFPASTLERGTRRDLELKKGEYDLTFKGQLRAESVLTIHVHGCEVRIDGKNHTISLFGNSAPLPTKDGKFEVRLLIDRSSVEVFAQQGLVSMTSLIPMGTVEQGSSLFVEGDSLDLEPSTGYHLRSSW